MPTSHGMTNYIAKLQQSPPPLPLAPAQPKKLHHLAHVIHSPESLRLTLRIGACHPWQTKCAVGEGLVCVDHEGLFDFGRGGCREDCLFVVLCQFYSLSLSLMMPQKERRTPLCLRRPPQPLQRLPQHLGLVCRHRMHPVLRKQCVEGLDQPCLTTTTSRVWLLLLGGNGGEGAHDGERRRREVGWEGVRDGDGEGAGPAEAFGVYPDVFVWVCGWRLDGCGQR